MEERIEDAWVLERLSDPAFARDYYHANEYELVPKLIPDGKRHKTAIICPGGGYGMVCSYVEGDPFAEALNKLGYNAVIVYYRVRELAAYPNPQDDLARAVREIHAHADEWNLDMAGYSVWGSSAGGHLVGSFGTENMGYPRYNLPKPGALVLIYPVVTMTELTHAGTRQNLLGEHPTAEQIAFASNEQHVTSCYPPTFLWCGDADGTVPHENSHMLASALEQAQIPYQFVEYPGIDHGVGLGTGTICGDWLEKAVSFWQAHGGSQEENA